jgi:hypothetical protein
MSELKFQLHGVYDYFHQSFVAHVFPRVIVEEHTGDLSKVVDIEYLSQRLEELETYAKVNPIDSLLMLGRYHTPSASKSTNSSPSSAASASSPRVFGAASRPAMFGGQRHGSQPSSRVPSPEVPADEKERITSHREGETVATETRTHQDVPIVAQHRVDDAPMVQREVDTERDVTRQQEYRPKRKDVSEEKFEQKGQHSDEARCSKSGCARGCMSSVRIEPSLVVCSCCSSVPSSTLRGALRVDSFLEYPARRDEDLRRCLDERRRGRRGSASIDRAEDEGHGRVDLPLRLLEGRVADGGAEGHQRCVPDIERHAHRRGADDRHARPTRAGVLGCVPVGGRALAARIPGRGRAGESALLPRGVGRQGADAHRQVQVDAIVVAQSRIPPARKDAALPLTPPLHTHAHARTRTLTHISRLHGASAMSDGCAVEW